jgi:hypothetical protein
MATRKQIKLRRQWIAALRSGKFKQGTGFLKKDGGYCCLGVLCEVAGVPSRRVAKGSHTYTFEGQIYFPPLSVMHMVGLKTENGAVDEGQENLVLLNETGSTFKEIATFIENNPSMFID